MLRLTGRKASGRINVEILDLPSLTPQAMMVALYNALLQSNDSTADTSYHVTGSIDLTATRPRPSISGLRRTRACLHRCRRRC